MHLCDYRPYVMLGLATLCALIIGLVIGQRLVQKDRRHTSGRPALSLQQVVLCYLGSVVLSMTAQGFVGAVPGIAQGIIAITLIRYGFVFLLVRRMMTPPANIVGVWLLVLLEITLGLTGFFATFRESLIMVLLAVLERSYGSGKRHWGLLAGVAASVIVFGMLWVGIKRDLRQTYHADMHQPLDVRLAYVFELSQQWAAQGWGGWAENMDQLMDRQWDVRFPALALARVPSVEPHANGAILYRAVYHITHPRLIFPNKRAPDHTSDLVTKYTGVRVAGRKTNTSIAFGYVIQSYIDFGVPLMFVPVIVYGVYCGFIYRLLLKLVRDRELAVMLVCVIAWFSLFKEEVSWAFLLGKSLTMLIFLGGGILVIDRFLARPRERLSRPRRGRAQVAPRTDSSQKTDQEGVGSP